MGKHKKVSLSNNERDALEKFVKSGKHSVHLVKRATIILALDTSESRTALTRDAVAAKVGLSKTAVSDIKADWFRINNVQQFLQRKKRETPPVPAKITGEVQAHIIALACTEPPAGRSRWTLKLLANKSVELHFIDAITEVSVETVLKKINFNLTEANTGAFRLIKTLSL
jgi:hypothetical protein